MKSGLLWFDNNDQRDLVTKILHAADYYNDKYGYPPNMCLVHPSMLEGQKKVDIKGLDVRASNSVLPNHFWIGEE